MFLLLYTPIALLLLYLISYYQNVRRYPKGPFPLPLIGNLYQLTPERLHLFFEKCHRKYGDVFTVWTMRPMVVLMEYQHIREALLTKDDIFLGRSHGPPENIAMVVPNGGITFAEGESWRRQRRVAVSILKELTSQHARGGIEQQVRIATDHFIAHLEEMADKDHVDFSRPIQILIANVINKLLFGYYYSYDDDSNRPMKVVQLFSHMIEDARKNYLLLLAINFPWIATIPFIGWHACGKYRRMTIQMHEHVNEDVSACLKSFDEDAEPACFVHSYRLRGQSDSALTEEQLLNVCVDLFQAGMETTATTLRWAVLLLAKYRDVQIGGVAIPEDTLVQTQFHSVHAHEWEQPANFDPERFLREDGRTIRKEAIERLNPFGLGKRQCAGPSLRACKIMQIHSYYFSTVDTCLSRFEVAADGEVNLTPIPAVFLLPHPQNLRLIPLAST